MDNSKMPWLGILHYLANCLQELAKNKPVPAKSYLQFCEWEVIQNEYFHNKTGEQLLRCVHSAKFYMDRDEEIALLHLKNAYNLIGKEVFNV